MGMKYKATVPLVFVVRTLHNQKIVNKVHESRNACKVKGKWLVQIQKVKKNLFSWPFFKANLSKGTKVIGLPEIGGFSEYVTINKNLVIPISDSISSTVGASLPINYGTTYYALKRRAKVTSGESLLILGGSGGIGTASIQLGNILGLDTIAAVGSDEKEEYVKNVGANHVIRYDKQDLKNPWPRVAAFSKSYKHYFCDHFKSLTEFSFYSICVSHIDILS